LSKTVERLIEAVAQLEGVTASTHRFGGIEWRLGKVEIGHVHSNGLVDIPFTIKLRDRLVADGLAEHHHILPESGWISFWMRDDSDFERAVWLVKLSYVQKAIKRLPDKNLGPLIESLGLSADMKHLINGLGRTEN
jgi:hypothetical protein